MAKPQQSPQLSLFGAKPAAPKIEPVQEPPPAPPMAAKAFVAPKATRGTYPPPLDVSRATLLSARIWLQEGKERGVQCPCCDQYAKIYRRKINSGMAASLLAIYRRTDQLSPVEGWLHIPDDFKGGSALGILQNREYPKLRYWGLLESFEGKNDNADVPFSGKWRITTKGQAFCLDQIRVPKYVFLFDGKPIDRAADATVNIREALGDKFSFDQLMGG